MLSLVSDFMADLYMHNDYSSKHILETNDYYSSEDLTDIEDFYYIGSNSIKEDKEYKNEVITIELELHQYKYFHKNGVSRHSFNSFLRQKTNVLLIIL